MARVVTEVTREAVMEDTGKEEDMVEDMVEDTRVEDTENMDDKKKINEI